MSLSVTTPTKRSPSTTIKRLAVLRRIRAMAFTASVSAEMVFSRVRGTNTSPTCMMPQSSRGTPLSWRAPMPPIRRPLSTTGYRP